MKLNFAQWLIAAAALLALFWQQRHQPWTPLRAAGVAVCMLAFVLVSLARYQLGRSFTVTAEAKDLVTTGLYARLRNPIYIFAELFLFGLALYLHTWWPVIAAIAAAPIQVARARKEAAVLEAAFGDVYRSYRARTWF